MAPERVVIPRSIRDAVVQHADFCMPYEACGLLASDSDGLRMAFALTNVERSAVAYTVSPDEHFGAIQFADKNGLTISGSFHSHVASPPYPSATDVAGALDPEWLYLILGEPASDLRGYRIRDGAVRELRLVERHDES